MEQDWDQLADKYHDEVITPFDRRVKFRLPQDLRSRRRQIGSVIDFGCGCGEAIEHLAGQVPLAVALDYSVGMLESTRKRLRKRGVASRVDYQPRATVRLGSRLQEPLPKTPTTLLLRGDMRYLSALRERFDLALSINSICPSTEARALRLIEQVGNCVVAGGEWISVFPSLDTVEHLFDLHRARGLDTSSVGRIREDRLFISWEGKSQKYFSPAELEILYDKVGFDIERMEKIEYPWSLMRDSGWGYFPKENRIWDWYVVAKKRG